MSVPLARLNLQGYKSFARRTEFLFERGITAIVGPNGSGKSNLADALRWVLGEQSYSTLRGRRTEDMIFSGSQGHRRLGMAQASLTFDNDRGWLPIDFSEVTISRRAYRSGENEYVLNGARVRLRDIAELLAEAGLSQRTYTVIGQGLVDRALALHPQERRLLFEEAAGIVGYQARRNEAVGNLEETQHNLIRVQDIIAEITPRLTRLARQAEEAEQQAQLSSRLEEALHIWYGFQWQTGRDRLQEARARAKHHGALLSEAQTRLGAIQQEMAQLQNETQQFQAQRTAIREEREALERRRAEIQREQAVRAERKRLFLQRQADSSEERSQLQDQEATQDLRIAEVESVLAQLAARCQEERAKIECLRAESASLERERSELRAKMQGLRQRASELFQAQAQRHAEWGELRRRRDMLLEARLTHQEVIRREQERAAALETEHEAIAQRLEDIATKLSALEGQLHSLRGEREALQSCGEKLRGAEAELERETTRLTARRELLSRIRHQGYQPGVQAVLKAAKESQLTGIRGPVAELLRVPARLEGAVQAALSNRLQDVVVEDWTAAQRAIAFLTGSRHGRATFLPLRALRASSPVQAPQLPGVIGRASDLVSSAEGLRELTTCLLGRTLVVQDLKVADLLLPALEDGCQIVTLQGEVVRADRSVTGGSEPETASEMLAREGEWRQLPGMERELWRRGEELARQNGALAGRFESLRGRTAQVEADIPHVHTALAERTAEGRSVEQALQQSIQALDWQRERAASEAEELASLNERESLLQEALGGLEAEATEVRAELVELEDRDRSPEAEKLRRQLERVRTASAVGQEALRRERERLHEYRVRRRQIARQLSRLAGRQREDQEKVDSLQSELQQLAQRQGENSRKVAQLAEQEKPIGERLNTIRSRRQSLARAEHDLRQRIRKYEGRANHSSLAVARCQDELHRLQERVLQDLGLTQLEIADRGRVDEELATQPPLPLGPLVTSLPNVVQLPEGLEEEIRLLRSQLSRLRRTNPEAPAEYAEQKGRHDFLINQASDLEAAAHSLRQVVSELDQVMESRFSQTFEAVADQFAEYFSLLFEGGHTELILTEPQDLSHTGVDIRVRPPGKREQGLALLSGGERSLTAVALIFAILTVSPTPFCLLDEVDAMLDEANSGRFRHLLERLAEQTQFIVITHNRQTIEAADTIYGLSMDENGVSQVISLRLDEVAAAVGA